MGRHGARRARSSPQPARDPLLSPVAEPLLESAPLARRLAPQLCRRDPRTRETCAAYHGFWQYARILGLGTAPDLHAGFLLDGIARAVSGTRQPRIAISGAADYSMLAHVLAAWQASSRR
ncbi:MAG TPA: hypothetical protein VM489_15920 [Burkholderiales bacterium]|nr:hypothetical protein [Burkholderiales bacterium]